MPSLTSSLDTTNRKYATDTSPPHFAFLVRHHKLADYALELREDGAWQVDFEIRHANSNARTCFDRRKELPELTPDHYSARYIRIKTRVGLCRPAS
ncbi:hypothetical protein RSOL_512320, partial [Rhizoctonia solani AG-3 Rhs1AP]